MYNNGNPHCNLIITIIFGFYLSLVMIFSFIHGYHSVFMAMSLGVQTIISLIFLLNTYPLFGLIIDYQGHFNYFVSYAIQKHKNYPVINKIMVNDSRLIEGRML